MMTDDDGAQYHHKSSFALVLLASTHFSTHQSKTTSRFVSSTRTPKKIKSTCHMASFDTAESLKAEGNKALLSKDYDAAIEKYTDALDLQPSGVLQKQILSNRSHAYNLSGDFTNGMCDANKLIDIDPKYKRSYLRLAQALHGNGELSSAIKACDDGLQQLPNNQDLVKFRAKITRGTGHASSATHGPSTAAASTADNLSRYSWYIRVFIVLHAVLYPVMPGSSFFRIMLGSMIINFMIIYAHHGTPTDAQSYAQKCVQNVATRSSMQTLMYSFIFLLSRAFFAALVPILIVEGW